MNPAQPQATQGPLTPEIIGSIHAQWAPEKDKVGFHRVETPELAGLAMRLLNAASQQQFVDEIKQVRQGVKALGEKANLAFYEDLMGAVFSRGLHQDLKPMAVAYISGAGDKEKPGEPSLGEQGNEPLKLFDGTEGLVRGNDDMFQNRAKKSFEQWERAQGLVNETSRVIPSSIKEVSGWLASAETNEQLKDRAGMIREAARDAKTDTNHDLELQFFQNVLAEAKHAGLGLDAERMKEVILVVSGLSPKPLAELRQARRNAGQPSTDANGNTPSPGL